MSKAIYRVRIDCNRANWPFCWLAQVSEGNLSLAFESRTTRKGAIKAAKRAVKTHEACTTEVIAL